MKRNPLTYCVLVVVVAAFIVQGENIGQPPALPPTMNGLTITTSTNEVFPYVTDELIVKCIFSKSNSTQATSLVSLVLSTWNNGINDNQDLITITAFDYHKVTIHHDTGAQVEGSVDQNGQSHLSMTWRFPSKETASQYMCTAYTVNPTGHPSHSAVGLDVKLQELDIYELAKNLKELKAWRSSQEEVIKNLTSSLEHQAMVNRAQENVIFNQSQRLDTMNSILDSLVQDLTEHKSMLDFLRRWMPEQDQRFHMSNIVIDHQTLYWFDGLSTFKQAKVTCAATGGKLAEFPYEKLNAVKSDLQAAGMASGYAYSIGLTRSDPTSDWVYQTQLKVVLSL